MLQFQAHFNVKIPMHLELHSYLHKRSDRVENRMLQLHLNCIFDRVIPSFLLFRKRLSEFRVALRL